MSIDPRLNVANLELADLELALERLGHPRFHAGQIFRWIYKRGVTDFGAMSDLSRELRAQLGHAFVVATPEVVRTERPRTARRSSC